MYDEVEVLRVGGRIESIEEEVRQRGCAGLCYGLDICKLQGLPGGERIKVRIVEQLEGLPSCIAEHRDRRRGGGGDLNAERSRVRRLGCQH